MTTSDETIREAAGALHERFALDHEPHWRELDEDEQANSEFLDMAKALAEAGLLREEMTEIRRSREAVLDAAHIEHQREWSCRTFGPGVRQGVIDHIRKELIEVEEDPTDLSEWVDVILLGFDGAWRTGYEPQVIIDAIKAKQSENENRTWPDWRKSSPGTVIEHDRSGEVI